ncbi:OmpA family protein [Roseomonas alkaliterrae]|uniref:Flagellar motor protein MotB n=1 Tax=Neoroseomonas alkaliterrae TaxID=1452450 RepID=A0A840XSN1_9PROT|nr:OmpA family protein [Neoroseomonas alkaliterrae]MBB5691555.1 flagellar motor protein MotB [Neoroseomonas alkaliterrae]MBR0677352.1 OmpA family protein [Neoroseomonas alkaliterrae]
MARSSAEADTEGGEGYFASVSDLMVGILFVFLLMLTVLALNFREAEQQQVVALERYEQLRIQAEEARRRAEEQEAEARRLADVVRLALSDAQRQRAEAERQAEIARLAEAEARRQQELARERTAEAEALRARNERLQVALDAAVARLQQEIREREEARANLLERLRAILRGRGVIVDPEHQSGLLRLSGDVLFASNSAELSEGARRAVEILADVFVRLLPCFTVGMERTNCGPLDKPILEAVLIEGHTDQRGTISNNDRLSAERALSVFAAMRDRQPTLENILNSNSVPLLGISGYGQRRPVALGSDEAAFAQNRRIDIRFVLSARTSEELRRLIEQIDALRQVPP